jgi:putative endonuclease
MPWFLYVAQCSDKTLYTGITTDILRRLKEHNAKKGAFYTKNKIPVKLVYWENISGGRPQALKREAEIKKLTRKEKLELVGLESS